MRGISYFISDVMNRVVLTIGVEQDVSISINYIIN